MMPLLLRARAEHEVLVTCSAPWTSPARLPWVLRRAGCRVSAFCPEDSPLASTRFVDRVITAPTAIDAYVDALEAHLARHRYAWVILTDDMLIEAIVRRRDSPALAACFPVDPAGPWVHLMGSKAALVDAARDLSLPIAPSASCRTLDEAREAARRIGYPVILKDSVSWGGLGVRAARSEADLIAAYGELHASEAQPIVLQRRISGKIGSSIALFSRGRALTWTSAFKARTYPGPFGPSSARQFMSHPDVEPMLAAFAERTRYRGFAAFDWVLDDETERLTVIELNTRAVPTIHLARFAGVDFAQSVRAMVSGRERVQRPPELARDAPVIAMFPEDFYRASVEKDPPRTRASPREWRYRDIPWSDWPLLAYHVRTTWKAWRELAAAARAPSPPALPE